MFRQSGDGINRIFLLTNGIWHHLSIIFNEIVSSNKLSLEPQHYLEGSYMPIFALIFTLEPLGLQLLKNDLA